MTILRRPSGRFATSPKELARRRKSKRLHAKLAREVASMKAEPSLPILTFIEQHGARA